MQASQNGSMLSNFLCVITTTEKSGFGIKMHSRHYMVLIFTQIQSSILTLATLLRDGFITSIGTVTLKDKEFLLKIKHL